MKNEVIIKLENVVRQFQMGDEVVNALKGVNLEICEGEFVTIMGASGSGKSTLLNILGCLDSANSGDYYLDGSHIKSLDRNQLADIRNKKLGFIFQSYNLLSRTNALENVELPLLYNNAVSNEDRRKRALEVIEVMGLTDRIHHTPSQLSGGQQQRIAIARALVNNPRVIFADEATGNLDTKTSYEIMDIIQKLNQSGKTIVFVTHEPDIAAFSSRTITLKDGMIISDQRNEKVESAEMKLKEYQKEKDHENQ
ncbi:MAG TPA: ABC transporter ATP-binding protein [Bacteroidales bacterium]|nr:ABC transporter ATP-binding protein [Bacteroidales bacterium]HPS71130.1 ABC transporter ATP-binding protein [Bacteroidales bacterium]